jgi:predicted nucleotidyltransferase component of viral defense system
VIEKGYVLGWMLAGIAEHPDVGPSWVFKGGIRLKMRYFETWRFSQDLNKGLVAPNDDDR